MDQKPDQPSKAELTRTRVFLLLFFGAALLLSITTMVGSMGVWQEQDAAPPPAAEAPQ